MTFPESWEGFAFDTAFDTGRCDTRALPWERERKQGQETRENYRHALCFCSEKIVVSKALIINRLKSSVIIELLKVPSPMYEALHQDWEWLLIPSLFLFFCCFNRHEQKIQPRHCTSHPYLLTAQPPLSAGLQHGLKAEACGDVGRHRQAAAVMLPSLSQALLQARAETLPVQLQGVSPVAEQGVYNSIPKKTVNVHKSMRCIR